MSAVPLDLEDLELALKRVDAVYLMWPFFESGEKTAPRAAEVAEILAAAFV